MGVRQQGSSHVARTLQLRKQFFKLFNLILTILLGTRSSYYNIHFILPGLESQLGDLSQMTCQMESWNPPHP